MSNRRSVLTLVGGIAILGFALQKTRAFIGTYLSDPPLIKLHKTPAVLPTIKFDAEAEGLNSLANFAGKHVLVNVWAKWCPPCKEEMPSLDRLQEKLGKNADLKIIAISLDPITFEQIRAFYAVIGVSSLALYRGNESEIMQAFEIPGLPTSLLINHTGQEIGRMIGPTVWDSPKVVEQITKLTA